MEHSTDTEEFFHDSSDFSQATELTEQVPVVDFPSSRLVEALHQINAELKLLSPQAYWIDKARWEGLLPLMAEQQPASGSPSNSPKVPELDKIISLYQAAWG